MGFNKEEFAKLLEKAKGNRSINKYASDVDLSPAHISRLLRQLLDTPPSPETIGKLSNAAFNDVTYDDFMIAAGHIDDIDYEDESYKISSVLEKKFLQALSPYLFSLPNVKFVVTKKDAADLFNLIVEFTDNSYSKWYFIFQESLKKSTYLNLLGQLSLINFKSDEKITIVSSNQKEYLILLEHKPQSLNINLYAMFIDLNNLEVIKEEVLCQI